MTTSEARAWLTECALILAAGMSLGLVANALSPRGIALRRNYFPRVEPVSATTEARPASAPRPAPAAPAPPASAADQAREARFASRRLRLAAHDQVAKLFRDPRFAEGRIVFIDARDDQHYQGGHIPGAFQLDHYRIEKHAAEILPVAQIAEEIVVYCNGGDCEDSELAAGDLIQFGIPASKFAVYAGGIGEWKSKGLPVELGARGSGRLQPR